MGSAMWDDLPEGWRKATVEQIASPEKYSCVGGPFGSKLSRKHYVPTPGVPVVRGVNVGDDSGRFVDDSFVFVSEDKAETLVQNMAYPGDLLFTQRGTLGQVAWIPEDARFPRYVVSQSQMKLTVDPEVAEPGFIYAYFTSDTAKTLIHNLAITTGVPHINLGILRGFPVPLPPLNEQRRIAAALGALDDKIEANRRMNRTLEALAQALFRQRFVAFDGRDDLVDSGTDLGEIPAGWRVGSPSDVIEFNPRVRLSKGTEAPYLGMSEVPTEGFHVGEVVPRPYAGGAKFVHGDTLLARITPCLENGKTALVDFLDDGEVGFGSTEFIVMRGRDATPPEFVYCLARSPRFREFAISRMTGSSGRQRVPTDSLDHFEMAVPPPNVLAAFGAEARPPFQRISANQRQSRTLAALRDALLPALVSGRLRVPEA